MLKASRWPTSLRHAPSAPGRKDKGLRGLSEYASAEHFLHYPAEGYALPPCLAEISSPGKKEVDQLSLGSRIHILTIIIGFIHNIPKLKTT